MAIETPTTNTQTPPKESFKDKLMNRNNNLNKSYNYTSNNTTIYNTTQGDLIQLSKEKNFAFTALAAFRHCKVSEQELTHNYLRIKLTKLWKLTEQLILIDLGYDFYVEKFNNLKNARKALHEGPWFITKNFLSMRQWEPNFVPKEATQTHTAIWLRLPQLLTEFYDQRVLEMIGSTQQHF